MSLPEHNQVSVDIDECREAFCQRMQRNAMLHMAGKPVAALHFNEFQELGFFQNKTLSSLPTDILDIVRNASHPKRVPLSLGPFVFVQEGKRRAVIELSDVLLSAERTQREAAIQYFRDAAGSSRQLLSSASMDVLTSHTTALQSNEPTQWRPAAIGCVIAIRNDLFWQMAGLAQSIEARYDEGFEEYCQLVLRPSFKSLMHLRPPVFNATEQRDEIGASIEEFAALSTLDAALRAYYNLCGYLPLAAEMGASRLAQRWVERHPGSDVGWNEIWAWANDLSSPFARYHMVAIALEVPIFRPKEPMQMLWDEVSAILDTTDSSDTTGKWRSMWSMRSMLATHFTSHVEALYPGVDGERIACYGWWLADKVGSLVAANVDQAERAMEQLMRPEAELSHARWTIARSLHTPSSLRYVTLHTQSLWALSLTVKIIRAFEGTVTSGIPQACRETIARMTGSHLVTSPLMAELGLSEAVFAIEEDMLVSELCRKDEILTMGESETVIELKQFRQSMADSVDFQKRLGSLLELNEVDQHLTVLSLRASVFSTNKFDDVISEWLEQSTNVIHVLKLIPLARLQTLLEALAEFQQRPRMDLRIRLPHMLAYAIEQLDDIERVRVLNLHAWQMAINIGIASPIQRVMASKWRAELLSFCCGSGVSPVRRD